MSRIAYTVTANFPDEPTAQEFEVWLRDGHVQAVLAGGANSASVIRVHAENIALEIRYLFPNQQAFDRYVAEAAPALRAQSLKQFPPERGILFERRSGVVLESWTAPGSR